MNGLRLLSVRNLTILSMAIAILVRVPELLSSFYDVTSLNWLRRQISQEKRRRYY